MRPRTSRFNRELVFRTAPWVPVPPRSVAIQAGRGALAEGIVAAALHPIDGLVLRATLTGGASSVATASSVRLFVLPSLLQTAGGAAAGAAAFALAYAALCHVIKTRRSPERTLVAAGTASILATVVDAPIRIIGAGARMDRGVSGALAWGAAGRDFPNDAVEFATYELLRRDFGGGGSGAVGAANRMMSGAVAGIAGMLTVAPIDSCIAHMLAHPGRGFVTAFRDIWSVGRMHSLYAGVGRRAAREAIASALFFVVYDDGEDDNDVEDKEDSRR